MKEFIETWAKHHAPKPKQSKIIRSFRVETRSVTHENLTTVTIRVLDGRSLIETSVFYKENKNKIQAIL